MLSSYATEGDRGCCRGRNLWYISWTIKNTVVDVCEEAASENQRCLKLTAYIDACPSRKSWTANKRPKLNLWRPSFITLKKKSLKAEENNLFQILLFSYCFYIFAEWTHKLQWTAGFVCGLLCISTCQPLCLLCVFIYLLSRDTHLFWLLTRHTHTKEKETDCMHD